MAFYHFSEKQDNIKNAGQQKIYTDIPETNYYLIKPDFPIPNDRDRIPYLGLYMNIYELVPLTIYGQLIAWGSVSFIHHAFVWELDLWEKSKKQTSKSHKSSVIVFRRQILGHVLD